MTCLLFSANTGLSSEDSEVKCFNKKNVRNFVTGINCISYKQSLDKQICFAVEDLQLFRQSVQKKSSFA